MTLNMGNWREESDKIREDFMGDSYHQSPHHIDHDDTNPLENLPSYDDNQSSMITSYDDNQSSMITSYRW